jgi:hypothetical protein
MAMGGTGYALSLPKASVGAKQLKKGSVTSKKVKNASLLKKDFKAGQLPAGPQGPAGAAGPRGATGAPGSAAAFADVTSAGTVFAPAAKNITSANISHTTTGVYYFQDLPFSQQSAITSRRASSAASWTPWPTSPSPTRGRLPQLVHEAHDSGADLGCQRRRPREPRLHHLVRGLGNGTFTPASRLLHEGRRARADTRGTWSRRAGLSSSPS